MFFLRYICDQADVLKVIYFINKIIDIVTFLVPMFLIVMTIIDFSKNVIGNEGDMPKRLSLAIKKIVMAAFIFLIPVVVTLLLNIVGENTTFTACLNNANLNYIASMEAQEKAMKVEEELKRKATTPLKTVDLSNGGKGKIVSRKSDSSDGGSDGGSSDGGSSNGGSSDGGSSGGGSDGGSSETDTKDGNIPEDSKYYPLDGKKNGKKMAYLEYDGKYLSEAEMKEITKAIKSAIKTSDNYATRTALAGWALAYYMSEKGVRLHYSLGCRTTGDGCASAAEGAGAKCSTTGGFCKNWGKRLHKFRIDTNCLSNDSSNHYVNFPGDCGKSKYYIGLDCSGFVSWAASMACGRSLGDATINSFKKITDYSKIETGDALSGPGHIRLFLKKVGDKYLTVESTSAGANGVFFHKYSKSDLAKYSIIKMNDGMKKKCK